MSKTCRQHIPTHNASNFFNTEFPATTDSFTVHFTSSWNVKSKWQVMICVCCKCLSTFLTWAIKASLFRAVEHVLSATKPNAKIHNIVAKPSLIQRDWYSIETPENTWATGATGFRFVTNSLQKNTSQMKLCLFGLRRAALPNSKLLVV